MDFSESFLDPNICLRLNFTSAPTRLRRVSHLPASRDFGNDVPIIFNKADEADSCGARRRRVGALVGM
ncbi:hypothetical protein Y032_0007g3450 [Ancylostoma ceylanicum]|uniref:Uncharacterized protein n=1 Tax=Ancylostoma ceylanicum TaxID=53326 RepID=A0A016VNB3_9BILA|nr:hypothetical protein Y032_0007g3450 [Ancylostoma ceylanicum]